jgi:hypothetical protein
MRASGTDLHCREAVGGKQPVERACRCEPTKFKVVFKGVLEVFQVTHLRLNVRARRRSAATVATGARASTTAL